MELLSEPVFGKGWSLQDNSLLSGLTETKQNTDEKREKNAIADASRLSWLESFGWISKSSGTVKIHLFLTLLCQSFLLHGFVGACSMSSTRNFISFFRDTQFLYFKEFHSDLPVRHQKIIVPSWKLNISCDTCFTLYLHKANDK